MSKTLSEQEIVDLIGDLAEAAGKANLPPSICDKLRVLQHLSLSAKRNEADVARLTTHRLLDLTGELLDAHGVMNGERVCQNAKRYIADVLIIPPIYVAKGSQ